MTDKLVLTDLSSLQQQESAITVINSNNHAIVAATNLAVSRDGTAPNQMLADFDMNGYRILNLPAPTQPTDPVRLEDLEAGAGSASFVLGPANFGNPSATVGTVAHNGTAVTAMRSDAAPAIDQTLSPTMTGNWFFAGSFSLPVVSAPASPPNGQLWNQGTSLLRFRDSGTTRNVVLDTATQTLTNKSISGDQINSGTVPRTVLQTIDLSLTTNGGVTGNLPVTNLAAGSGASSSTFWRGDGTWASPGGTGTVNAGTAGQLTYYATSTNAVSSNPNLNVNAGALTLGIAGGTLGQLKIANLTSGLTTITPLATSNNTLSLPASTDTLVGKATTDILTNKTYDTAGTGNIFKINGTTLTAVTGTGNVVLSTSPTLVTPALGTVASGVWNGTAIGVGFGGTGVSLSATGGATSFLRQASVGANITVGTIAVSDLPSATSIIDGIGSTQGQIIYRGASNWTALSPGTVGQLLKTNGAGADPSWVTATGTGTVTSVSAGFGLLATPSPITGSGSIAVSFTAPPCSIAPVNHGLTASASAGALTITLTDAAGATPSASFPVLVPFRSSATNGQTTWLAVSGSTTLVVPSGALLGTINASAIRLWVVGFNDAGTFRLGVINCAGTAVLNAATSLYSFTDTRVATSTAIDTASDSSQTFYTGTAVSLKPFCVLGYIEWDFNGVSTAGTWTTANLLYIQPYGPTVPLPGSKLAFSTASTTTRATQTTNTSYVDPTGVLTGSFTPGSAANFLKVTAIGGMAVGSGGANAGNIAYARLVNASGPRLVGANQALGVSTSGAQASTPCMLQGYDWPNAVTSQTYKVQVRTGVGTTDVTFPWGDNTGSPVLGYMLIEEIMV